jgi:hypothetical protein
MSSSIRTVCPESDCGEVKLGVRAVTLIIDSPSRSGSYAFTCPNCGQRRVKPADERVIELLLIAGVEPQSATTPVDPPFTPDDLLAFHELLATDDWFDHLLRADAAD